MPFIFWKSEIAVRVLLLTMLGAPLSASVLFYGGDPAEIIPGYYYDFYNEQDTGGPYTFVYGNFTVPEGQTWTVNGFFVLVGDPDPNDQTPLADWDLRTGMTASTLGTDYASGASTIATTSWTAIPQTINGDNSFELTVTLPTPLILTGGQTYYLNVAPIDTSNYNMFMGLGFGTNSIGTENGEVYYVGSAFAPGSLSEDPALGVLGTEVSAAPEPGTWILTGSLLAAVLLRRGCRVLR